MAAEIGTEVVINIAVPSSGKAYTKVIYLGAAPSVTLSFTGASIYWAGGTAPTMGEVSALVFTCVTCDTLAGTYSTVIGVPISNA